MSVKTFTKKIVTISILRKSIIRIWYYEVGEDYVQTFISVTCVRHITGVTFTTYVIHTIVIL